MAAPNSGVSPSNRALGVLAGLFGFWAATWPLQIAQYSGLRFAWGLGYHSLLLPPRSPRGTPWENTRATLVGTPRINRGYPGGSPLGTPNGPPNMFSFWRSKTQK